jgi:hypothetical protein
MAVWNVIRGRTTLGRALWFWWAQVCPLKWRAALVPHWALLQTFVHDWLALEPTGRVDYIMRHFSAVDSPYRAALGYVGSMRAVFGLVEGARDLKPAEQERFCTPPFCMPPDVTWHHIASGTVGILSALRIHIPGLGE